MMCCRVGIRLGDVLALQVEALERAVDRLVHHVGDAQARLVAELHAPESLEHLPGRVVRDVPVAGELVRERAHVAGALHVVLAAQRIHPHALAADVAGRHGEIGDRHHRGRPLRVLGDAEAVVDRAVAACRVEPRRPAQLLGIDAGRRGGRFRRMALLGDEARPGFEIVPVATLRDEGFVHQAFGHDHMRHGGERRRRSFPASARGDGRPRRAGSSPDRCGAGR